LPHTKHATCPYVGPRGCTPRVVVELVYVEKLHSRSPTGKGTNRLGPFDLNYLADCEGRNAPNATAAAPLEFCIPGAVLTSDRIRPCQAPETFASASVFTTLPRC